MKFHPAEKVTIDYLAALHPDTPVGRKAPPGATTYIHVRRLGGTSTNIRTDAATLVFEVVAPLPSQAEDLMTEVREDVFQMKRRLLEAPRVNAVREISGPMDFPDPDRQDITRFTMTATVSLLNVRTP